MFEVAIAVEDGRYLHRKSIALAGDLATIGPTTEFDHLMNRNGMCSEIVAVELIRDIARDNPVDYLSH